MRRWYWATGFVWLALLGLPAFALARELVIHPTAWQAWSEWRRLLDLAWNTFALTVGTMAVALPLGFAAALLLYRSDLPGRRFFRSLVILALFIPLPLLASAWQSALGSNGWLPTSIWRIVPPTDPDYSPTGISWKPWAQGLVPAIWIHTLAGVPWVIWLCGVGLNRVERNLEEDALVNGGIWNTLRYVSFPRALPALGLAALWLLVQTTTEIAITDMMQVRTFAEEVYTQFARPDPGASRDAAARALVVALPPSGLGMIFILLLLRNWERRLPPLALTADSWPLLQLGRARWLAWISVVFLLLVLLGMPIGSLVWKTGQIPPGRGWSASVFRVNFVQVFRTQRELLNSSFITAVATAALVSALALISCWLFREKPRWAALAFIILIISWMMPGPILGIGLKESINLLMRLEDAATDNRVHLFRQILYSGPSPLPVMWADAIRFLPCAVALLWPATRVISQAHFDVARTDGARPADELRHVVVPSVASAVWLALLAVTALSLGELSAGKMVETPGGETFAHELFMQMHYGTGNHLAAMCLLLLSAIALPMALYWMIIRAWGVMKTSRLRIRRPLTAIPQAHRSAHCEPPLP
jgi:iron(III) transport system permease protein